MAAMIDMVLFIRYNQNGLNVYSIWYLDTLERILKLLMGFFGIAIAHQAIHFENVMLYI
jgi:hypothetical protein